MASGVLRDVSNIKIARLAKQQSHFEEAKASILLKAKDDPNPLSVLVEGLKKLGLDGTATDTSLLNSDLFKEQVKHDASISRQLTGGWENELMGALDAKSRKYEFTSLFAKLATEWADTPNDANVMLQNSQHYPEKSVSSSEDSEDFEPLGREEMHKQRQEWDSNVFSERKTDTTAIDRHLLDLFSNTTKAKRDGRTPLERLRLAMQEFGVDTHGRPSLDKCQEGAVRSCVKNVLKADLFTGKKRDALIDLADARPAVLKEIADVINMEASSLDLWQWGSSPIPAHMRRQLNGKYRVYVDPEIHQALLVNWIGASFAVYLKDSFTSFFRSGAWTSSQKRHMNAEAKARRKYYVTQFPTSREGSVKDLRRATFQEDFFMTQLPSTVAEGNREYGEESPEDDDEDEDSMEGKSPLEVKQSLLHIATTEMLLQKKLYGKFTLVQTDFKWFGPSLPHSTIFAVLKFFQVPDYWLRFFAKFLAMPMVFPDDGPEATARTRKCGVPIGHVLSDALGEAVLFCLDFAVHRATRGNIQLYRFHDDLWFWGQEDDCVVAWKRILSFSEVMGLRVNEEKTGSFTVTESTAQTSTPSSDLPQGPVRWGFLVFSVAECRWTIDMGSIDEHIDELRHQLVACRSIFSEIQVWNSYVSRFFSNNFGQAANCMGREHLDMVLSAFRKIQRDLFASLERSNGSHDMTSYLKAQIGARFDLSAPGSIPDSFISFPLEYGGLDVRNPFIPLLALHKNSIPRPSDLLASALDDEASAYEAAKARFLTEEHKMRGADVPPGCDARTFCSEAEYVLWREETSLPLQHAYEALLSLPDVHGVEMTGSVGAAIRGLASRGRPAAGTTRSIGADWAKMDTYWRWIVMLYAREAVAGFGGLMLGEENNLPLELVRLLRSEKVRWQG